MKHIAYIVYAILGMIEFILRLVTLIILVITILGIFILAEAMDDDGFDVIISPILWKKIP